jgi:hypothetical protein
MRSIFQIDVVLQMTLRKTKAMFVMARLFGLPKKS